MTVPGDRIAWSKARLQALEHSPHRAARHLHRVLKALSVLRHMSVNPRFRSEVWTRLRHGSAHLQGSTHTAADRYPALFALCRAALSPVPSPRLVSFGCSTGEEAATLARYFPDAVIVGVDINRWCLRHATRRFGGGRLVFVHRSSRAFARLNAIDAVFCMAVFQRTENRRPGTEVVAAGFTFAVFASEVGILDAKLKVGGLFVIEDCDFAFEETDVACRYRPLDGPGDLRRRDRPLFDRRNRRVTTGLVPPRCFVKLA